MDVLQRIEACGIVPVVVIDNVEDALPTAKALLCGGIDVMEVTFRTEAAQQSLKTVSEELPEMIVGAGTVITLDQAKAAVDNGAKFIVAPGFNREVVSWCRENSISVVPGCVTPSEIMEAKKFGLNVLKFFPANVYGGLTALKSLAGPFNDMRFIPTGGINIDNIHEYIASPYVFAVGGSWICPRNEIKNHNFEFITSLCHETRNRMLGYEFAHIGINPKDEQELVSLATFFNRAFGFEIKKGNSSDFASSRIEMMKESSHGRFGHIAISTNKIEAAIKDLIEKGYSINEKSAKYKDGHLKAIYMNLNYSWSRKELHNVQTMR